MECSTVMQKCGAEIVFILMYVIAIGYFIIGVIYQVQYGKIYSILVEVAIALVADQLKSVITQFIIYWIVIRRFGRLSITSDFKNGKWDDEAIFNGGVELSLFATLRETTKNFVEN